MGHLDLISTSTAQPLFLRLGEHRGRERRWVLRARGPEICYEIVLFSTGRLYL